MVHGNRHRLPRRAVRFDLGAARVLTNRARILPAVDGEVPHGKIESIGGGPRRHASCLSRTETQIAILLPRKLVEDPTAQHQRESNVKTEHEPPSPALHAGERAECGHPGHGADRRIVLHGLERAIRARAGQTDRDGGDDEQHHGHRHPPHHDLPDASHEANAPVTSRAAAKPWRSQYAAMPSQTRAAVEGSVNVAVPTATAVAPASRNSIASFGS